MENLVEGLIQTLTDPWGMFGLVAQSMFMGSFLVQWVASERAGRTVVPTAFWYMRMIGSVMLLSYALFGRQDSIIVLGQLFGVTVYSRNLMLTHRHRRQSEANV